MVRVEYEIEGPAPDEERAQRGEPGTSGFPPAAIEEIDLSGQEVDTIGFVRALPSIATVAVQDESGATVAEAPVPERLAYTLSGLRPSLAGIAHAQSAQQPNWPYMNNLPPYCSHVILLEGEIDRGLAQGIAFEDQVELVAPGPNQRASIYGALRRMTPMLCQGIRRIATGIVPSEVGIAGAVRTRGTGDMMIINVGNSFREERLAVSEYRRLQMMGTVFHEAGHATDALINVQGSRPEDFAGDWILPARSMASQTIDRVRLEKGLRNEWRRFHESFRVLDWATEHQTSDEAQKAVYNWSPRQISDGGFMSHYAATSVHDDIAEMVEWSYVSGEYLARGWTGEWSSDFACQEMRSYRDRDLPGRLVTVYTKLMFLKDLGLLAEEDVETCMGPDIGLPIRSAGFHFWHDGNMLRSFDSNLTAKIGTIDDGTWVFEMEAEGEASFDQEMYPAKIELRIGLEPAGVPLHLVAWPRGIYKLGLFENNTVRLRLDGAPAGDFDVKDGYVLVAEASEDRMAGSIFLTVAMRFGAPLPVPQTWKPPLIIRFLIDK